MARNAKQHVDLGFLGVDYQMRLVKCFIEHQDYFANLYHIVDQNMFTDEQLRRIVALLRERYSKTETVATYLDLDVLIRTSITDEISIQLHLAMLDKIRTIEIDAYELVEEAAEKFFKQQNLVKAINKAQDIIKKGNTNDYYSIEDTIKNALETNIRQDLGFGVFDNYEDVLSDDYRKTITTGCPELDESLYGGLGKGELGLIIAPLGVGKTSVTTGFVASAATTPTPLNNFKGYKCLHLFFEDTKPGIQRKYYGYITGVEACDLSKPGYRETALAALEQESEINKMLKENVRCKRLSSGEVTASEIKNIIRNYHKVGFKPDLVVLDYFECLKPEKTESFSDSEWSKEGVSMRKLESICNEMQVAMWVPVQGTKGSIGVDTVTVAHAGGSVKKTQIGHVILTLAQTDEQKQNGKLNLTIGKLRAAKIGRMKYNDIGFNNGTCRFDMSSIYEVDNALDGNGVSSQAQNIAKNVAKENKK